MRKPTTPKVKTQLRITKELNYKVHAIAEKESRNYNSQLEFFIKRGIEDYERVNGVIDVPPEELSQ